MVLHNHSSGTNFSFYLTFQGLPNFIKSPEDQTGISGGVASFVCQAAGEPKPRITWMKKGKKVSSQRFEVTTCRSLPLLSMTVSLPCHLIIMPFFFPSSVICSTLLSSHADIYLCVDVSYLTNLCYPSVPFALFPVLSMLWFELRSEVNVPQYGLGSVWSTIIFQ